jgi:hypothetical protein
MIIHGDGEFCLIDLMQLQEIPAEAVAAVYLLLPFACPSASGIFSACAAVSRFSFKNFRFLTAFALTSLPFPSLYLNSHSCITDL